MSGPRGRGSGVAPGGLGFRPWAASVRWPLAGVASALVWTVLAFVLYAYTPFAQLKRVWLDEMFPARQALERAPRPSPDLVVVGIDEASLQEIGKRVDRPVSQRWMIRYLLERLLVLAAESGVRAVAVDFLLDAPVDEGLDADIAALLSRDEAPRVVLGALATLRENKGPIGAFAPAPTGNLVILADRDGKYRRLLPGLLADAGRIPLFAFQACRALRGALEAPMHWADGFLVSGPCRAPNEMLLDFVGPAQTLETLGVQHSALDLLQGRVEAAALAGKLMLVGPSLRYDDRFTVSAGGSAEGDGDYLARQMTRHGLSTEDLPERPEWRRSVAMSGLEIQANAISQILDRRFPYEFSERHPGWNAALTFLVTGGIGWLFWSRFLTGAGIRRLMRGIAVRVVTFLLVAFGAMTASVWLFSGPGLVFIPLELLTAWTAQAAAGTVAIAFQVRHANQQIEQIFGPAVGEDTLRFIKENPVLAHTSRQCVATVLEADIRGFTSLTDSLGASQTVDLLREYFERMWEPLVSGGGWVEQYTGDAVMAAWNVLYPVPDHAYEAVRAAVGMKLALAGLNAAARPGLPPIDNGIGIVTGELVVGNVGSLRRHNQTLIGDTANFAARVESLARDGEILIAEGTYQLVRERVVARFWGTRPIKGKSGSYNIYEVFGLVGDPLIPGKEPAQHLISASRADTRA